MHNPYFLVSKTEIGKSGNIHAGFKALNLEINQPTKNYQLRSVNHLYGEKSLPFSKVRRPFIHVILCVSNVMIYLRQQTIIIYILSNIFITSANCVIIFNMHTSCEIPLENRMCI